MKCDRCGKEIPDTDLYCGRCGKAVFPEYMDEADRWAYYKTDEELEEILRAEQEGKEVEPAKLVKITRFPKEKEKVEEPVQEEVLQTEEEREEETEAAPELNVEPQPEYQKTQEVKEKEEGEQAVFEEISEDASPIEENVWEEDFFEDEEEEEEEDEKPPLSPERKKKRWKITALITLFLLLCLGIGIALGMKRMKDLDRQEKEYYEKLHKEVVHQDTPSSETEKEMDEKEDTSKEETPEQKSFQLVNPDEIDFSQYQKITPVSAEQNSVKESDTYDYSAKSAIDGDSSTSWQENEEGTGETTGIQINLDGNHKVRYLVLYLGNWRSDQLWEYSARPKTLTIQIDDSQTKDVEFSDEKKKFCLSFDEPIDASYISMYIADSYEGSRWSDNGISEVEIYE